MSTESVVETVEPVNTEEHGAPEVEQQEGEKPEAAEAQQEDHDDLPKGVKKRLGKMSAQLRQARQELEQLREIAAQQHQRVEAQDDTPPKLEDFDFDQDKYDLAKARWAAKQEIRAEKAKAEQVKAAQTEAQKRQKAATVFDDVRESIEDVESVIAENPVFISPQFAPAVDAILDADAPVAKLLLEHILKNPAKAEQIAALSPYRQAVEIGKIEAMLTTQTQKQSTRAPEPVRPVGGKPPQSKTIADTDKTDIKEWMEMRNRQLYRR